MIWDLLLNEMHCRQCVFSSDIRISKESMWCNVLYSTLFMIITVSREIISNVIFVTIMTCIPGIKAVLIVHKSTKHDLRRINQPWLSRCVEVNQWDLVMLHHRPSVWFWWFLMLRLWPNHFRLLNVLFILQIFCKAGSVLNGQVRAPPSLSLCSVLQPLTTLLLRALDADSPPLCVFAVVETVTFSIALGMHDIWVRKSAW